MDIQKIYRIWIRSYKINIRSPLLRWTISIGNGYFSCELSLVNDATIAALFRCMTRLRDKVVGFKLEL